MTSSRLAYVRARALDPEVTSCLRMPIRIYTVHAHLRMRHLKRIQEYIMTLYDC